MADALKKANAESKSLSGENKSLCTDLEKSKKNAAEREGRLAVVEEKIRSLEARLSSAETAAKALAPAMESTSRRYSRLALTAIASANRLLWRRRLDFSEWAGPVGSLSSGWSIQRLLRPGCHGVCS